MGDNINTIEEYAFGECSDLKSIRLFKTLECIEKFAFNGCDLWKLMTPLHDHAMNPPLLLIQLDLYCIEAWKVHRGIAKRRLHLIMQEYILLVNDCNYQQSL